MRRSFTRLSTIVPRVAAIALLATAFTMPQVRAESGPVPLRSLEDAIESSTDAVLLPTSQPGTLTFRNCAEPCAMRALEVTAQSAFYIGDTPVTLAEFNAYVRRGGPKILTVFRQPGRTNVTRLVVIG
jgi:formylglycine-generating enzyme required for sulfatase activity